MIEPYTITKISFTILIISAISFISKLFCECFCFVFSKFIFSERINDKLEDIALFILIISIFVESINLIYYIWT